MSYDYSPYRYLLPQQLEILKARFQSVQGTASFPLEFKRATQGPLGRLLREIGPASFYVHLTSAENPCAGLVVLNAPLAYGLVHRQLGDSSLLQQSSGPLLQVEISFIRKELHQLLPVLTMPCCNNSVVSIESIATAYQPLSNPKREATWSWVRYAVDLTGESTELIYAIPNQNLEIVTSAPLNDSTRQKEFLQHSIKALTVSIRGCLGSAWMNQEQLQTLTPGTVLTLVEKVDSPIEVQVNQSPTFFGKMGLKDEKKAIIITANF